MPQNKHSVFSFSVITLILIISFFVFSHNKVSAADMISPTVDITYSKNPVGLGTNTITATYSESITNIPTISINQQGTADIPNTTMTKVKSENWVLRPFVLNLSWSSITYGNGLFVTVGTDSIMTSSDGKNWGTPITQTGAWKSVAYGNGTFVAVGTNIVMTSSDGINWTNQISQTGAWVSVTFGNNNFVAVANGKVMKSTTNGTTWEIPVIKTGAWVSVTFGNNNFVAVAYNITMSSVDGTTWDAPITVTGNWKSISYINNLFMVVGNDRIIPSVDGKNWGTPIVQTGTWVSVAYYDGQYVVVGNNIIMTSLDGITWIKKIQNNGGNWKSIAYGNGIIVVVGNGTNNMMTLNCSVFNYNYTVNQNNNSDYIDGQATVALSNTTDVAGNPTEAPTHNTFNIDTTGPKVSLSYSKDIAGTGINTISVLYSEPILGNPTINVNQSGLTDVVDENISAPASVWTNRVIPQLENWNLIAYGNGIFVAISFDVNHKIMTSSDGINWIIRETKTIGEIYGITYGNGLFVAVGSGVIMTSSDGINWGNQILPEGDYYLSNVTYGNGLFVAVGEGFFMTSHDGIDWTVQEGKSFSSIAYGNGIFVAIGSPAAVSSDGEKWNMYTIEGDIGFISITYGNGIFVAIGDGIIITSIDGINWKTQTVPEANSWKSITYGNGLFVAVADYGTNLIATSSDGINWKSNFLEPNFWSDIAYGNGIFLSINNSSFFSTSPDNGGNYLYNYTVNQADGTNYIDGESVVSLSPVTDLLGNPSFAPTNTTFNIDTSLPPTPTSTPVAGSYVGTQSVTLQAEGSESIRYSLTEIPSSCSVGTLYTTPIEVSSTSTIYAIACNKANNSSSSTFDYIINNPVVVIPPTIVGSSHSSGGSTLESRNKFIAEQKAPTTPTVTIDTGCTLSNKYSVTTGKLCTTVTIPVVTNPISITRTLKQGSNNNDVKELQKYLNAKGYIVALKGAGSQGYETNYFGPATKKAIILFQTVNKLTADGIVGAKTVGVMK